ncbi:helix-turn-helix domain-containing protein [Turicibacter sanguinis]|uniref:helix-turn-helix domain-containing protein n=1 Tax=Turicibacter sanguinis TaxID=154288 RepID=UPI0021D4F660|nr:helix-turn-helix transcriptional regulator [Turicibacter sanguinis]MCU7197993.1 helix-turn-helix transcriptional regulator [Turicibacter sanguinis]MDB8576078.1 helix-turn-helix transcriptional regulator [Turicibacter sanguinis]MDB8578883.1 helix-turn-helix transcriptional regulator [Turicibacter sanguinis]MDB8584696.1 helix-turn-helix transcriptional regulator [Turicibacter sanguinis]MDB8587643.1 helix-turn-helix transcriptional regulator [Turicibacter sanguinis]
MKQSSIFSENLKTLRKQKRLTGAKLAQKLNISHSTLASWETGRHIPHLEDIIRLADFFEVSIDELLGRDEEIINSIETNTIDTQEPQLFFENFFTFLKKHEEFSEKDVEDIQLMIELIKLRNKKKED